MMSLVRRSTWVSAPERIRTRVAKMDRLSTLLLCVLVSLGGIALFYVPPIYNDDSYPFNGIFGYVLVALYAIALAKLFKVSTLAYIAWPRHHWLTYFAFGTAATLTLSFGLEQSDNSVGFNRYVAGALYVFSIALGEEFVDRVLIFGLLQRFGTAFALLVSSALFGLSHMNVYVYDWNIWDAFHHVMSAFGFGLFMGALLIATRSIWVPVFFHMIYDWPIIFETEYIPSDEEYVPEFWDGIGYGVLHFIFPFAISALLLLFLYRGRWPKWIIRLAIRWKLVEQAK